MSLNFYLGTHMTGWLGQTDVPLFVSRRRLCQRKSLPRAKGRWALDSGGFSELSMYGKWTVGPHQYAAEVRRWRDEIGGLDWAAIQDWMCEPHIIAKTGLTVERHQWLTTMNYAILRDIDGEMPWVPVIQGWHLQDYIDHVGLYQCLGYDLTALPVVGVGSVCRRQGTAEIAEIMWALADLGISIHGFGVKTSGLALYGGALASADSMAWSYGARYDEPMPGCAHKNCANCMPYALRWRRRVLAAMGRAVPGPHQQQLPWLEIAP